MRTSKLVLAGALGAASVLGAATQPAWAAPPAGITVALDGLVGPVHVAFGGKDDLYVADAFAGEIVRADLKTGSRSVLAHGGFEGVDVTPAGSVLATQSLPPEGGDGQGPTSLVRVADGAAKPFADLLAYEKKANPDGQHQGAGAHADSLSNPYDVLALPGRSFVADAGANDVLEVASSGKVRTVVALPVSKKGRCATQTNNGVPNGGCDPVPTALAMGADGYLYVSGLGAEVEGHVWKVDVASGRIVRSWDGLPPLTGIAVGANGSVYAASIFANQIFRIAPSGAVKAVEVSGPTGLRIHDGALYAGSVDLSGQHPGQVLRIPLSAFF